MPAVLTTLVLEFARAEQAGDPHAFRFVPQEYLLRGAGGGFETAQLEWNAALLADLSAARHPDRDPALLQRLGETLRRFVAPLGWAHYEQQIAAASYRGERVLITISSAAAELYALPWELLTIKATGQHLGEMPGVLLRYQWPETTTAREQPTPRPDGGRILFAWSAAAGGVPAAEQLQAIASACRAGFQPFDPIRDVLANVSCRRLGEALAAAQAEGPPIAVLHLLCHGGAVGSTFGLVLDSDEAGAPSVVVDAGRLRQVIARYAGMVRLVVVMACDSANPGTLANQLGSVAQTLHRAGIALVVASRYPLSVVGANRLTAALYQHLLGEPASLESSLLVAREQLAREAAQLDWASIQLYARAADGDDSRPIVVRPYRGLAAFLPEDRRFYFGRGRDVERIVKLLTDGARLVTMVGASGAGKSSLILAGVVPTLASKSAFGTAIKACVVRPGAEPCQALALALTATAVPADDAGKGRAVAGLRDALLLRATTLADFAAQVPAGRLLLIVDQFEELFLQSARPEAAAFIDNLLHAIATADGRLVAVLTLRADFLGLGLEVPALAEQVRATLTLILPMNKEDLRAAIVGPAALVGLKFEEGLVDALLDGLWDTEIAAVASTDSGPKGGSAALSAGSLPLLQFTLEELWERRRGDTISWQAWRAIGGVRGAIARRANEILLSSVGEEELVRRLFERLVQLGEGTIDTRRRARREEVEAIAPTQMKKVLDRWIAARMITADAAEVTIAHEALIREWETLRRWIDESRESLRVLQILSRDAQRYGTTGKSADDLWHGTPLRRALKLQAEGRLPLSAAEAEFLAASEAAAEKQRRLVAEQQRLAHDSDVELGQKPRTLGLIAIIVLATVSYLGAILFLHKVTHELFMMQIVVLMGTSGIIWLTLFNTDLINQFNRKVLLLFFSAMLPVFTNHWVSWWQNVPVPTTQVFNLNVFMSMALAATLTMDRRLWRLVPLYAGGIIIGTLWPRWVGLLLGIITPTSVSLILFGCASARSVSASCPSKPINVQIITV